MKPASRIVLALGSLALASPSYAQEVVRESRVFDIEYLTGTFDELPRFQTVLRRSEAPAESILAEARSWEPDLIVMGSHTDSSVRLHHLGGVSERVVRYASCPVMILGRKQVVPGSIENVVLPVDFSSSSEHAAEVALGLCREHGAALQLVHIVESSLVDATATATGLPEASQV